WVRRWVTLLPANGHAAERTPVDSSFTRRLGLRQRPGVFPDGGNPTRHLCAWCGLRTLRRGGPNCRGLCDDHVVRIRVCQSDPARGPSVIRSGASAVTKSASRREV